VTEYENAPNGKKGVIPRREGRYSSHIVELTDFRVTLWVAAIQLSGPWWVRRDPDGDDLEVSVPESSDAPWE
jgi:hypothetical protein